jgi:molybdopterin converting factor subunit 1
MAGSSVTVLYFAALADVVGSREEVVELSSGARTVAQLIELLIAVHPGLRGREASLRVAVNESFAQPLDAVRAGDVVALIPPVAGG